MNPHILFIFSTHSQQAQHHPDFTTLLHRLLRLVPLFPSHCSFSGVTCHPLSSASPAPSPDPLLPQSLQQSLLLLLPPPPPLPPLPRRIQQQLLRSPPRFIKISLTRRLHLGGNFFSGHIPDSYSHISTLEYLRLNGHALSGPIHSVLSRLPKLKEMYLGYFNSYDALISPDFGVVM